MKNVFKRKTKMLMLASACLLTLTCGAVTALNASATTQSLSGFECAGASVNAEQIGVRFVFNLSGEALSKQDKTAGVVYIPYDMYTGDINDFTKEYSKSAVANFTWQDNAETQEDTTDKIGYTYLDAAAIPSTMYNRVLLVRGFIEDGESVYYTAPVKTSMAYSAWKGIEALGSDYEEQLKAYMGPYTLTYGDGTNDNVSGLYYGDTVTGLPEQINEYNVEKWYWDKDKTNEIKETDYATGSMNIYYEYVKYTVSGTVSCSDSSVDLSTVKIAVDGVGTEAQVSESGEYSLQISAGIRNLEFSCDGYIGVINGLNISTDLTQDVTLISDRYDVYSHKTINGKTMAISDKDYTGIGYGTFDREDILDGEFTYSSASNFGGRIFNNTSTTEDYTYTVTMNSADAIEGTCYGIAVTNGEYILSFQVEAKYGQTMYSWYTKTGDISQGKTNHWINTNSGSTSAKQPWSGSNTATLTLERIGDELKLYAGANKYLLLTVNKDGITLNSSYATTNPTVSLDLSGFFGTDVEQAVGISCLAGNSKTVNFTVSHEKESEIQFFDVYSHKTINGKTMAISDKDYTGIGYGTFDREDILDGEFTYSSASNFGGRIFNNTSTTKDYTYTVTMNSADAIEGTCYGIAVTNGEYILSFQVEAKYGQTMYSWYTKTGDISQGKTNHWINTNSGSTSAKQPWSGSNTATLTLERTGDELKLYAGANKYLLLTVNKDGITLNTSYATTNPTVSLDLSGFFGTDVEQAVGISCLTGNSKTVNFTVDYTRS